MSLCASSPITQARGSSIVMSSGICRPALRRCCTCFLTMLRQSPNLTRPIYSVEDTPADIKASTHPTGQFNNLCDAWNTFSANGGQ
jgi:hypothetical protein